MTHEVLVQHLGTFAKSRFLGSLQYASQVTSKKRSACRERGDPCCSVSFGVWSHVPRRRCAAAWQHRDDGALEPCNSVLGAHSGLELTNSLW